MAKLGSPNLQHYCESTASGRPRSAGSVCQVANRWPHHHQDGANFNSNGQQQQLAVRRPGSPLGSPRSPSRQPGSPSRAQNLHPWHREQLQQQNHKQQQQPSAQQGVRSSTGLPPPVSQQQQQRQQQQLQRPQERLIQSSADARVLFQQQQQCASNSAFGSTEHHRSQQAAAEEEQQQQQELEQQQRREENEQDDEAGAQEDEEAANDEVLLYGELLSALRRGGGTSLRAEAILEQLLQELGAARAALSTQRGEGLALRSRLASLEAQHSGCHSSKKRLQVRRTVVAMGGHVDVRSVACCLCHPACPAGICAWIYEHTSNNKHTHTPT